MDHRILIKVLGAIFVSLGVILTIPALYSAFDSSSDITMSYVVVIASSVLVGFLLWLSQRDYRVELNNRTAIALVSLIWISTCLIGAFPYYLSGTTVSFYDALFEATSGLTGTGASILNDVEAVDRSILLWRSLTQWLGGMGIILFFLSILPLLGLGGVQLFRAEFPGPQKDRVAPRVRETAKRLWIVYVAFTAIFFVLFVAGGMPVFDAANHALTGIATGGFSTRNGGFGHFNSDFLTYVMILAMFIGAINFTLHYRFLILGDTKILLDTELKWFLGIVGILATVITLGNWGSSYETLYESFKNSLFVTVAMATSTGYSFTDYTAWVPGSQFLLILLTVMGGLSGSTAGGIKCIRIVAAAKQFMRELKRLIHPNAVLTVKINKRSVSENIMNAIWGFIFLYFFTFSVVAVLLMADGLDLVSAATAAVSCLSNIGPAFGELGPFDSYASLTDRSKIICTVAMLLGRLEFYTVVVLVTPVFWKR
jgi:trk system potassium uptake protein TrkH